MGPVLFDKNENKLIEFGGTTEFVIGRAIEHHLSIPHSAVSRKQCVIKKVPEGEWLVKDLSTFRTTLVNGSSVPSSGLLIKSGDTITFGNLKSWFLEFYLSTDDMPSTTKRKRAADEVSVSGSQETLTSDVECSRSKKSKRQTSGSENMEAKYQAVLDHNAILTNAVEELKLKCKELEEAKETADDILVCSHLDRKLLHIDYEDRGCEIERLAKERQALLEENEELIKKREAAEALASNCGSSSQLTLSSEIESSLILKTIEVEELKDELTETKSKLAVAESTALELRDKSEKIYNDAVAIVEQEFLCCVCSDLMYQPVTLNCRHTMCGDCLKEWKKKKKECPSCRTKIKTEVSPLMVDSFIDRIAPLLGDEFIKKRQEAKNDRAAPKTPPPPPPPPYVPVAGPSQGGRSRRGARRGSRGVRSLPLEVPPPLPPGMNGAVIDLTSTSPGNNSRRINSVLRVVSDLDALAIANMVNDDELNAQPFHYEDSDNFEDEFVENEVDDEDDDEEEEDDDDDEEDEDDDEEGDDDDDDDDDEEYDEDDEDGFAYYVPFLDFLDIL